MPNRILKESICTSENIDSLSAMAEIAFYRLIVNCDDYGRMDGRVKIIKSRLFPLKDVSEDEMLKYLAELEQAELIKAYVVDGKPYLQMTTWESHQQVRNHKSKYPSPDESSCEQLKSIDINCNQVKSIDSKCPRNPIQSESLSESESYSLSESDAHVIQGEQNQVLNAAENAGFQMSNMVRARLIALYADSGLKKMLDGIESCSKHGATNLAYLEAVLNGSPKKAKPKVNAQDYDQRSYDEVSDEIMQEQIRDMEEWMKRGGAG